MTHNRPTLETLSSSDEAQFVEALGNIFEHSPWIAAAAWESRPFTSIESLHGAMVQAMHGAGKDRQIALIRAHPQLGGHEAHDGRLTTSSKLEQSGAGLNHCSAKELEELHKLNAAYLAKFGFPFIMAVKNRTRLDILAAFVERTKSPAAEEFARCLLEIDKIAKFRLRALLAQGK